MEQPVSNELAQNVEMKFPAGIEARRVSLPQGGTSESWSPEEGDASANMRWGHFFRILSRVTSKINYSLKSDDPSQDFEATVFFSSTKQKPIILHYNTVSKVAKLYTKRFKIVQNCTKTSQGEIVQSDRIEIEVGGVDAMADLVQGTEELTVGDGSGNAGEIENEVHLFTRYFQSF